MMATGTILPHGVRCDAPTFGRRALFGADNVGPVAANLIDEKIDALQAELRRLGRVVVAFSGGADSAFLAAVAHHVLADDAHAVTAVSPSLAGDEEVDCRALAVEWGLRWTPVVTHEMERAAYRINDTDRCYHCKAELMDVVGPIAAESGATVVLGVNLDDLGDHRPGQLAADQRGAAFPLVTAGFTKADVRAASLSLGLRTWDKPAAACLASRVPYGTEVTVELLSQVDRAEAALKRLGFTELRVRHYGDTARIEVPLAQLVEVVACRAEVVAATKAAGYSYVTLDLEGFRSGNLNEAHLGSTP
jgi:pyridinium-3,5-biscarboxylic acid mononucleotide sulfurtransferase